MPKNEGCVLLQDRLMDIEGGVDTFSECWFCIYWHHEWQEVFINAQIQLYILGNSTNSRFMP